MKRTTLRLSIKDIYALATIFSDKNSCKMLKQLERGCSFNYTTTEHKLVIKRKHTLKEFLLSWLT